jgi:hypothetical protein
MDSDMKAKELFGKETVTEAGPGDQPPGGPPRRPRIPPPRRVDVPQDRIDADNPMTGGGPVRRMVGREEPTGQFTAEETSQLKDVLIQILARAANSHLDAQIGQALMSGQPLEPGQLQHILDEARQIELPESHNAIMQKIFATLRQ